MALALQDKDGDPNFDEEAIEREDFHCETFAKEFTEAEEGIRHDTIPDSNDEAEKAKDRFFTDISRGDGTLYKGQKFFNAIAFKESVIDYALFTGYNIKQYRYDKTKIGFECVGGGTNSCPWQVYASSLPKDQIWKIRVYNEKHNCIPNGRCEIFRSPVMARLFLDRIREEPEYFLPKKIEQIIKERWKISVTRPQCQAARNLALQWIEVEYDHQFARLRDYAAEILECNKDSVVEVDTIENEGGQDMFNRFYVIFDILRKTWKKTYRPLIGVDGCFLKAKVKDQLLVALGRDADNGIYPITWAVVRTLKTGHGL